MKILFVYNSWAYYATQYHESIVEWGRKTGLDIIPFCLTPNAPHRRYSWQELDLLWRCRHRSIIKMLNHLLEKAADADILWLYNGANFHPAWLNKFPEKLLTVYGCFDDPESSDNLSAPVARFFDACLVGNIASIPQYQSWGCHTVEWGPIFISNDPSDLNRTDLSARCRPINLVFFGERVSPWRRDRLDYISKKFPDAHFRGRGWPIGYQSIDNRIKVYRLSKIGINIHNSIGPVNSRLFELPAHGIMQICDNKCRLGHIFDLGREVVGFDNITEAADLIRYYLEHEDEREEIAWNGLQRFKKDYAPMKLWERYSNILKKWKTAKESGKLPRPPEYTFNKTLIKPFLKTVGKTFFKFFNHAFKKKLLPCSIAKSQYNYVQTSVKPLNTIPYLENPEIGPCNMTEKEQRVKDGGFFEWPNIIALNWTVASMVGDARSIIEIGSGTGCFAYEAGADPTRSLLCLEKDSKARDWAKAHRQRPNILYANMELKDIIEVFDLLVSIDVVEHIEDYQSFLSECYRVSKRAIITTPNRFRNGAKELHPLYTQHVREWSAGEFYWVLRYFWPKVELYAKPDNFIPMSINVNINTDMQDLIAICYRS